MSSPYEDTDFIDNEASVVTEYLARRNSCAAPRFPLKSTRLLGPPASPRDRTVYKVADHPQLRRDAFHLVYQRYLEAGLIDANPFRLRVTPYHLQPTSSVFVGVQRDTVACTVSLIGDDELGLPLERVYSKEVARKRSEGLRLAEVSCLAFHELGSTSAFWKTYLHLVRIMAQYARRHRIDALMIAVHPRHLPLHTRLMGFEQLGPVSAYPLVRNRPSAACCLQFDRIDLRRPPCYDAIFGQPLPERELACKPMSEAERIRLSRAAAYTCHADAVAVAS